MSRALVLSALLASLVGCPSEVRNPPGDAQAETGVTDATGTDGAVTADGGDASSDGGDASSDASVPPDIQMTFEFSSVALNGSAGGISMRANMTWHGNLRGSAGGITFQGEIRGATP